MSDDTTIDITNLVTAMEGSFVTWAVNLIFADTIATPGFSWVALPLVSDIYRGILTWGLNRVAGNTVMESFFLNTAVKKASQSVDYSNAVTAKNNLPADASDADYEKAEQNEISEFNSFVTLTS